MAVGVARQVRGKKKTVILHNNSATATGAVLSIKSCESFQPGNLLNFVTKPRAVRNYRGRQPSCTTACPKRFSHGSQSHCGGSKWKMKRKEHNVKNQLEVSALFDLHCCILSFTFSVYFVSVVQATISVTTYCIVLLCQISQQHQFTLSKTCYCLSLHQVKMLLTTFGATLSQFCTSRKIIRWTQNKV